MGRSCASGFAGYAQAFREVVNRGMQLPESSIGGSGSGHHYDVPTPLNIEGSQNLPQPPFQTVAHDCVADPPAYGQSESGNRLSGPGGVDDQQAIGGPPPRGADRSEIGLPPQALVATHNGQLLPYRNPRLRRL